MLHIITLLFFVLGLSGCSAPSLIKSEADPQDEETSMQSRMRFQEHVGHRHER